MNNQIVVSESKGFTVFKDEKTGKFSRKAKYEDFQSFTPETRQDKIALFNLMEGNNEQAMPMKDSVGEVVEVHDVILRKYDALDEDTGITEDGVLVYLFGERTENLSDRPVYVTSSKAVYFTLNHIMQVFGTPGEKDYEPFSVVIKKVKQQQGDQTVIELVE